MELQIDLQTHTRYSASCGWMSPETLVQRAEQVGLDGVAITDHNTLEAVGPAQRAASEDFLVIPGEEVDTDEGQIIGLFLSEAIEPWQSPPAVLDEIHDQGGVALAPHPFDSTRSGLKTITQYIAEIDAIETINSRCVRDRYNHQAQSFAKKHGLPMVGGSDAHFAREIGTAYTRLELDSPRNGIISTAFREENTARVLTEVKRSIQEGRVVPCGRTGELLVHVGTKGVKLFSWMWNR